MSSVDYGNCNFDSDDDLEDESGDMDALNSIFLWDEEEPATNTEGMNNVESNTVQQSSNEQLMQQAGFNNMLLNNNAYYNQQQQQNNLQNGSLQQSNSLQNNSMVQNLKNSNNTNLMQSMNAQQQSMNAQQQSMSAPQQNMSQQQQQSMNTQQQGMSAQQSMSQQHQSMNAQQSMGQQQQSMNAQQQNALFSRNTQEEQQRTQAQNQVYNYTNSNTSTPPTTNAAGNNVVDFFKHLQQYQQNTQSRDSNFNYQQPQMFPDYVQQMQFNPLQQNMGDAGVFFRTLQQNMAVAAAAAAAAAGMQQQGMGNNAANIASQAFNCIMNQQQQQQGNVMNMPIPPQQFVQNAQFSQQANQQAQQANPQAQQASQTQQAQVQTQPQQQPQAKPTQPESKTPAKKPGRKRAAKAPKTKPPKPPQRPIVSCESEAEVSSINAQRREDTINFLVPLSTTDDDDDSYHSTSSANFKSAPTPTPSSFLTPEEQKAQANRDRNREHARNTRLRKKAYLEKLKLTVDELCRERDNLVQERTSAATFRMDIHTRRTEVLINFFALRNSYERRREMWSNVLDESCFTCAMPVTPYRSFPASEVQISKCQRTIMGIDGMMADTASFHVLLSSLVNRQLYPNGAIEFKYTLITEDAVIAGNQFMARWEMVTTNASSLGARCEIRKQGMLACKFNSLHKILSMEIMFDVMAFMLQLKQASGKESFFVIPNTVQTCQFYIEPKGSVNHSHIINNSPSLYQEPMVMTIAERPYTIVQVNTSWEKLTGFKSEEVVGKASCRILQGSKTNINPDFMENIRHKRPASTRMMNYNKSGKAFEHFIHVFPLSTDSKITHYLGLTCYAMFFKKEVVQEQVKIEEDVLNEFGGRDLYGCDIMDSLEMV